MYTQEEWNYILIAGEEEAETGEVDVKTREHKRLGKMRVNDVHAMFSELMPDKSSYYHKFYEKAWDPAKFNAGACDGGHGHGSSAKQAPAQKKASGAVESLKVVVASRFSAESNIIKAAADRVGSKVELSNAPADSKAILPLATTANGVELSGLEAIVGHLARMKPEAGLLGSGPFQEAKVDEWLAWNQKTWQPLCSAVTNAIFCGDTAKSYNESL